MTAGIVPSSVCFHLFAERLFAQRCENNPNAKVAQWGCVGDSCCGDAAWHFVISTFGANTKCNARCF